MKTESLASPAGRASIPTPRTTRSYLVDAVAMALYLVAITVCAMFLDIPHPAVVAAVIAFVTIVAFNPMRTKLVADPSDPLANP